MSERLLTLPDHELRGKEAENYLLVIGFNELHNSIEQGNDEDPRSWVDFYADVIKRRRAAE